MVQQQDRVSDKESCIFENSQYEQVERNSVDQVAPSNAKVTLNSFSTLPTAPECYDRRQLE